MMMDRKQQRINVMPCLKHPPVSPHIFALVVKSLIALEQVGLLHWLISSHIMLHSGMDFERVFSGMQGRLLSFGEGNSMGGERKCCKPVVEVMGDMLSCDGQKLIRGERCLSIMLYPLVKWHQLNGGSSVWFSCFWSIHWFLCDFLEIMISLACYLVCKSWNHTNTFANHGFRKTLP